MFPTCSHMDWVMEIKYSKCLCLVPSLSATRARLYWAKIYIVAVMYCKNVQMLSATCNDFPLECHIR